MQRELSAELLEELVRQLASHPAEGAEERILQALLDGLDLLGPADRPAQHVRDLVVNVRFIAMLFVLLVGFTGVVQRGSAGGSAAACVGSRSRPT